MFSKQLFSRLILPIRSRLNCLTLKMYSKTHLQTLKENFSCDSIARKRLTKNMCRQPSDLRNAFLLCYPKILCLPSNHDVTSAQQDGANTEAWISAIGLTNKQNLRENCWWKVSIYPLWLVVSIYDGISRIVSEIPSTRRGVSGVANKRTCCVCHNLSYTEMLRWVAACWYSCAKWALLDLVRQCLMEALLNGLSRICVTQCCWHL